MALVEKSKPWHYSDPNHNRNHNHNPNQNPNTNEKFDFLP